MFKFLSLLMGLLFMTSCGDLFTKEKAEIEYGQFAACEMDTEAISKIFTENIKGELYCLERNLNLFIDVVKTDRPGFLSKKELIQYVEKNIDDVEPEMVKALEGVFDINSLLFGDDKEYISRKNVSSLVKILVSINSEIMKNRIYEFFVSEDKMSFFEHNRRKSVIYNTFLKLGNMFSEMMKENGKRVRVLDFLEKFENKENSYVFKYIKSVIFVKKAFLGGQEKYLSAPEVAKLATILGDIGKVVFDFVNLPNTKIGTYDDEEILKILKEDVATIRRIFYYKNDPNHPILTYDQIASFVNDFFPEFKGYVKYKKSFLRLKNILVGSNQDFFSAKEIDFLLSDLLEKNLARGVFFYRAYSQNKGLLDTIARVYEGFINVFTETRQEEEEFRGEFNRIVQDYRYFKGDEYSAKFNFDYFRNTRGVFEISLIEDVVGRFFKFAGSKSDTAVGGYTMSLEQFQDLVVSFEDVLIGENLIIETRAKGTAETITLIASLFLSQSDGNDTMEIPEFTEFVLTALSGLGVGNKMHEEFSKICDLDEKGRYTPQCFRENFKLTFDMEKDGKKISEYVPQLKEYVESLNDRQYNEFLQNSEGFARTCTRFKNGEDVLMESGDALAIWTGMMTTEQTMIRFDHNRNGTLEGQELEDVYQIYKGAIKGLMPSWLNRTSKDLFYYLIRYKRIPVEGEGKGVWQQIREGGGFVWHLIRQRFKKVRPVADRITFTTILKLVSQNSPENQNFDCELLR